MTSNSVSAFLRRCVIAALGLVTLRAAAAPLASEHGWVRSWGAAIRVAESFDDYSGLARAFHNITMRQIVVSTVPGRQMRVRLSTEFGTRLLMIGRAHAALSPGGAAIDASTDRELRFGGRASVLIPVGVALVNDPVEMQIVVAGSLVAISIYLPHSTEGNTATVHEEGWRTGYLSSAGEFTSAASFPTDAELHSYYFVSGVAGR
jgi:hypothetical protein